MALITCPECGSQISDKAESCPNCGLPMISNSDNNYNQPNNSDDEKEKKKKALGWIFLIIVVCIVTIFIVFATKKTENDDISTNINTESHNEFDDFKKTLSHDAKIVGEISNSNTKKIYYLSEEEGLVVHNFETSTSKQIMSYHDDVIFSWGNHQVAGERLFFIVATMFSESNCTWVFYIDSNDDSYHFVTSCAGATFENDNQIKIKQLTPTDTRGAHCDWEYDLREYYLDLTSSDYEYERIAKEQSDIDKRLRQQSNTNSSSAKRNNTSTVKHSNSSTVKFRGDMDVYNYLFSHTFVERGGTKINIKNDGIYINGSCATSAPVVRNIRETTATVIADIPYAPGSRFRVYVDSKKRTVTDATDGTIYYEK